MTFGSEGGLEETRQLVAKALLLDFAGHNSLYRGGDYYAASYLGQRVIVQCNEELDEAAEPAWPGPTIVYVMAAEDPVAVEEALEGLTLLSSRPWA